MPTAPDRSPYDAKAALYDPLLTRRALTRLPDGAFIMSAAFEGKRTGSLAVSVALCAREPTLISVALRKGHFIEPLVRDSRAFSVCRIDPGDRLLAKRFSACEHHDADPFDGLETTTLITPSPVLVRSQMVLDCEVVRHFDLEADCELFIGLVLAGKIFDDDDDRAK